MSAWLKMNAAVFSGTKMTEPLERTSSDPRLAPRPFCCRFRTPGATSVCSSKGPAVMMSFH